MIGESESPPTKARTRLRDYPIAPLAVLALGACSSPEPTYGGSPARDDAPVLGPTREDVERELSLELSRASSADFENCMDPKLVVRLFNRSADRSYSVLLPDGHSFFGGHEPSATLTIERDAPGGWAPLERDLGHPGCVESPSEVYTLGPGQRVTMPWYRIDVLALPDDVSRVRIVARYAYGELASRLDRGKVPPALWAMPRYALASAPLEIEIARSFALELKVAGPLPSAGGAQVAPALDAVLTNRSMKARAFTTPESGAMLELQLEHLGAGGQTTATYASVQEGPERAEADELLAPGERRSLVSPATKLDEWSVLRWGFGPVPGPVDTARTARVRAVYVQFFHEGEGVRGDGAGRQDGAWDNHRCVVSPWVDAR